MTITWVGCFQWVKKLNKNRNKYKAMIAKGSNSGSINSKVLITDKKVKYIEEPEQLQWSELKNE